MATFPPIKGSLYTLEKSIYQIKEVSISDNEVTLVKVDESGIELGAPITISKKKWESKDYKVVDEGNSSTTDSPTSNSQRFRFEFDPKTGEILVISSGGTVVARLDSIKGEPGLSLFDDWCIRNHKDRQSGESWSEFLKTMRGDDGQTINGKDGLSAYDLWKSRQPQGADTSEKAFWESLKGKPGDNGHEGSDGENGDTWKPYLSKDGKLYFENTRTHERTEVYDIKGEPGNDAKGLDGDSWTPYFNNGTQQLYFKNQNGIVRGPYDVKGEKGNDAQGLPGDSAYDIWLKEGHHGDFHDFLTWISKQADKGEDGEDGDTFRPHVEKGHLFFISTKTGERIDGGCVIGPEGKQGETGQDGHNVTHKYGYKEIYDWTCPVQKINPHLLVSSDDLASGGSAEEHMRETLNRINNIREQGRKDSNKGSWIQEFFWWCSGADRPLLRMCPAEHSKYMGIGTVIFFTALMAWLSSYFAIRTVFGSDDTLQDIVTTIYSFIAFGGLATLAYSIKNAKPNNVSLSNNVGLLTCAIFAILSICLISTSHNWATTNPAHNLVGCINLLNPIILLGMTLYCATRNRMSKTGALFGLVFTILQFIIEAIWSRQDEILVALGALIFAWIFLYTSRYISRILVIDGKTRNSVISAIVLIAGIFIIGWGCLYGSLVAVIAVFWALMIFFLDRFITNTMYSDGKVTISWRELRSALPRIIISIFLGIVISAPLELEIFKKEIDTQIVLEKDRFVNSNVKSIEGTINILSHKNDSIQRVIDKRKDNESRNKTVADRLDKENIRFDKEKRDINNTYKNPRMPSVPREDDPKQQWEVYDDQYREVERNRNEKLEKAKAVHDSICRVITSLSNDTVSTTGLENQLSSNKGEINFNQTLLTAKRDSLATAFDLSDGLGRRLAALHAIAYQEDKEEGYKAWPWVKEWWWCVSLGIFLLLVLVSASFLKNVVKGDEDGKSTTVKYLNLKGALVLYPWFAVTALVCGYFTNILFNALPYYIFTPVGMIMMLFILIDVSPVFYKMMLADGQYEQYHHKEKLITQDLIRLNLAQSLAKVNNSEIGRLAPLIFSKSYEKIKTILQSKDEKKEVLQFTTDSNGKEIQVASDRITDRNTEIFEMVLGLKEAIIRASYQAWYRDMRDAIIGMHKPGGPDGGNDSTNRGPNGPSGPNGENSPINDEPNAPDDPSARARRETGHHTADDEHFDEENYYGRTTGTSPKYDASSEDPHPGTPEDYLNEEDSHLNNPADGSITDYASDDSSSDNDSMNDSSSSDEEVEEDNASESTDNTENTHPDVDVESEVSDDDDDTINPK